MLNIVKSMFPLTGKSDNRKCNFSAPPPLCCYREKVGIVKVVGLVGKIKKGVA